MNWVNRSRRHFVGVLTVVLLGTVGFTAGCRPAADDRPDTLVIGVLADIQSWNPYLAETQFSEDLLALVYPSLVVEQPDYHEHPPTFAPSLAESWSFSDDALNLTMHLRDDVVWSDGQPVTAEDVVFTWRAQIAPEVGWYAAYTKENITAVEALDPKTVRFTFAKASRYSLMDANEGLILPAHRWREIPFSQWSSTSWFEHVSGAGPFLPVSHTPQQQIVLGPNPRSVIGAVPSIERVVWRIVPDQLSLMTQLMAGQFDFVNSLAPDEARRIEVHPEFDLIDIPHRSYTHLCWNTTREPLTDPNVRRALALAVDRQAIIDTVYLGFARPSVGPILSTMWAFDSTLDPIPHDPKEARRILKDAGWSDTDGDGVVDRNGRPFEFEILANSENHMRQDISLLVADDLEAVGVKAVPRTVEWGTFLNRLQQGSFDGAVNRWVEPTQIDLDDVWHSVPAGAETSNYGRYANPEVDRLLEAVAEEPDLDRKRALYAAIQQRIVADQPYLFLVEGRKLRAIKKRVRGAVHNDATPYFNLEAWTLR